MNRFNWNFSSWNSIFTTQKTLKCYFNYLATIIEWSRHKNSRCCTFWSSNFNWIHTLRVYMAFKLSHLAYRGKNALCKLARSHNLHLHYKPSDGIWLSFKRQTNKTSTDESFREWTRKTHRNSNKSVSRYENRPTHFFAVKITWTQTEFMSLNCLKKNRHNAFEQQTTAFRIENSFFSMKLWISAFHLHKMARPNTFLFYSDHQHVKLHANNYNVLFVSTRTIDVNDL